MFSLPYGSCQSAPPLPSAPVKIYADLSISWCGSELHIFGKFTPSNLPGAILQKFSTWSNAKFLALVAQREANSSYSGMVEEVVREGWEGAW